jgi:hypothetical protein
VVELTDRQFVFVGFKLDGSLRHQLENLSGPDRQYVSGEEGTAFLTICTHQGSKYVGKVVHERLTTERVDDVRRNVLSIVGRLCPEVRLPASLEIWVCAPPGTPAPAEPRADLDGEPERRLY